MSIVDVQNVTLQNVTRILLKPGVNDINKSTSVNKLNLNTDGRFE